MSTSSSQVLIAILFAWQQCINRTNGAFNGALMNMYNIVCFETAPSNHYDFYSGPIEQYTTLLTPDIAIFSADCQTISDLNGTFPGDGICYRCNYIITHNDNTAPSEEERWKLLYAINSNITAFASKLSSTAAEEVIYLGYTYTDDGAATNSECFDVEYPRICGLDLRALAASEGSEAISFPFRFSLGLNTDKQQLEFKISYNFTDWYLIGFGDITTSSYHDAIVYSKGSNGANALTVADYWIEFDDVLNIRHPYTDAALGRIDDVRNITTTIDNGWYVTKFNKDFKTNDDGTFDDVFNGTEEFLDIFVATGSTNDALYKFDSSPINQSVLTAKIQLVPSPNASDIYWCSSMYVIGDCIVRFSTKTWDPTSDPTSDPIPDPTIQPTVDPTHDPTSDPTVDPSLPPTVDPTSDPTQEPTVNPTQNPTVDPTADPTRDPTDVPTNDPTVDPSSAPTVDPSSAPTHNPTSLPTSNPTSYPITTTDEDNDDHLAATERYEANLVDLNVLFRNVISIIVGLFLFIAVFALIDAKLIRRNDYFRVTAIVKTVIQMVDMISDSFFAAEVGIQRHIDSELQYDVIFVASIFFIVCPALIALLQLYHHAHNHWLKHDHIRAWLHQYATLLLLLCIATGSSFAAVTILNSYIFHLKYFDMNLTDNQIEAFNVRRIYSVVLFENIPQVIIQTIYIFSLSSGDNTIALFSITFSVVSIIVSVLSITLQKRIQYTQRHAIISMNITGDCVVERWKQCRTMSAELRGAIARLFGINQDSINIIKPIYIENGFGLTMYVYSNAEKDFKSILMQAQENGKLGKIFKDNWKLSDVPMVSCIESELIAAKQEVLVNNQITGNVIEAQMTELNQTHAQQKGEKDENTNQ